MPEPIKRSRKVWEGSNYTVLERVVDETGTPLLIADVTSWDLWIFNARDQKRDGRHVVDGASPTGYFFDTLQTDQGWDRDGTGFNFRYPVLYSTYKANGGQTYQLEFVFQTADGPVPIVWLVEYVGLNSQR